MGQLGCGLHEGPRQPCGIRMEALLGARQAPKPLERGSGTGGAVDSLAAASREPMGQMQGAACASRQARSACAP